MKFNYNNAFARLLRSPDGDGGDGGGGDGGGTTTPPPLVGEDLTLSEGWQDRVGEHASGLNFTNLPDAFKSYKESQSTIGRLNTEKADIAKQFEDFKVANKAPEIPKEILDYQSAVTVPEKLPEGVYIPDGMIEAASKFGMENGVPPETVSKFVEFQVAQAAAESERTKGEVFGAIEKAKTEISATVGEQNYDTTIANAKAASQILSLDLDPENLASNPKLVIALSKIHTKISPGVMKELGIGQAGESAASASQKADDILNNENNPHYKAFQDPTHPGHDDARAEFDRLVAESA